MMKQTRSTMMIAILAVVALLAVAVIWGMIREQKRTEESFPAPNMETCEWGENYYYLPEDYVLDGQVIYTAGYYEGVLVADDSNYKIFVPVDPDTRKRLPSDHFSDGTTLELPDGRIYELHVTDGSYSAEPKEDT